MLKGKADEKCPGRRSVVSFPCEEVTFLKAPSLAKTHREGEIVLERLVETEGERL